MEDNDEIMIDDTSVALEDTDEPSEIKVIYHIMDKYKKAETNREQDEIRWLKSYKNYRGL